MAVPLPIACSLESKQLEDRRQEWMLVLNSHLIERSRTESGVRLRLASSPQALDALNRLVAAENQCCPWINWRLDSTDAGSTLEAWADAEEGIESLASLFGV